MADPSKAAQPIRKGASENSLNESRAIRELNQVAFAYENEVVQAYMTSNFGFKFASFLTEFGNNAKKSTLTVAALNIIGYVPAFDFPRWYGYQGSDSLKFTINAYLKLDPDNPNYQNDIIKPLKTLSKWVLPERKKASEAAKETKKTNSDSILPGVDIFHLMSSINAYTLTPPAQIKCWENKEQSMVMYVGRVDSARQQKWAIRVSEVFIKDVSIEFSKLIMDDGKPERVNLTIYAETLRKATKDLMEEILVF